MSSPDTTITNDKPLDSHALGVFLYPAYARIGYTPVSQRFAKSDTKRMTELHPEALGAPPVHEQTLVAGSIELTELALSPPVASCAALDADDVTLAQTPQGGCAFYWTDVGDLRIKAMLEAALEKGLPLISWQVDERWGYTPPKSVSVDFQATRQRPLTQRCATWAFFMLHALPNIASWAFRGQGKLNRATTACFTRTSWAGIIFDHLRAFLSSLPAEAGGTALALWKILDGAPSRYSCPTLCGKCANAYLHALRRLLVSFLQSKVAWPSEEGVLSEWVSFGPPCYGENHWVPGWQLPVKPELVGIALQGWMHRPPPSPAAFNKGHPLRGVCKTCSDPGIAPFAKRFEKLGVRSRYGTRKGDFDDLFPDREGFL